jgi:hypothetical protein
MTEVELNNRCDCDIPFSRSCVYCEARKARDAKQSEDLLALAERFSRMLSEEEEDE